MGLMNGGMAARWGDGGDVVTAVGGAQIQSTNGVLHVWNAVAEYLLERFEEPTLVFDRSGRVLALNASLERLLGWPRNEVLDHVWTELSPPGRETDRAMACLQGSVQGIGRRIELPVRTAGGEILTLIVNLTFLGTGEDQVSAARVMAARPQETTTPSHAESDEYYEISATPALAVKSHISGHLAKPIPTTLASNASRRSTAAQSHAWAVRRSWKTDVPAT